MRSLLKGRLVPGLTVLVLLIGGQAAFTRSLATNTFDEVDHAHNVAVEAALLVERIKLDVVQVQQWLTDISATRGLDGLNDGFDVADEFAQDFSIAIDELAVVKPELGPELAEIDLLFAAYHAVGIEMATAYIEGGPATGNLMMADFDTAAAAIGERVDVLREDLLVEAEQSLQGAQDSAATVVTFSLWAAIAIAGLSILLGVALMWWMVGRVKLFSSAANEIAAGRTDVAPPPVDARGIFGDLSRSFGEMTLMLTEVGKQAEQIAAGRISTEQSIPGDLGKSFSAMSESLGSMVSQLRSSSARLAEAATNLNGVSSSVTRSAEVTSTGASAASEAGDEVSDRVTSIASAIEQMNVTIGDVSSSAGEAASVATEAMAVAERASVTITKLGESSQEIGNVLRVINSIAEQTNLLALNATIEAARAGDAGKGFAVVANEVKELANQTADATSHISEQIHTIQTDAASAVEATQHVGETIVRINDISASIAGVVEEQSRAANEIGRNMEEVASSTQAIAVSITDVASAAAQTRRSTDDTRSAAESMTQMSAELNELVGYYR